MESQVTNRLAGERAIITGSTAGIGAEIARAFAREGAEVVVTGRDANRGDTIVAAIVSAGGLAHFIASDLNDAGAADRLVADSLAALGGITVLVNNASGGGTNDAIVGAITDSAWEHAMRMNVTVPMQLCRAVVPHLRAAGHGAILNISSRQAERASAGFTAYIASKSALNGLTRSIAVDYAEHNIRCNTISPGYVLNDRRDVAIDDARKSQLAAMHLTRLGTAHDVAMAAVYLVSHESQFVTGINLQLDGGSSIARGTSLG